MQLINSRRYVLGLTTLRLDECLSNAAGDHSKEMQDLKYFAHDSPVEKNKTPWDRAKNAAFEGRCMGENIFMGAAAPEAAFHGWWESDGHRFIMFQKEANTLGLGPATGRKRRQMRRSVRGKQKIVVESTTGGRISSVRGFPQRGLPCVGRSSILLARRPG